MDDFLKKFKEIKNRERTILKFADDDYYDHMEFTKVIRQDLCRLINVIPQDHLIKDEVFKYIKDILENCEKRILLIWYNSDFSSREISDSAAQIFKERFGEDIS